MSKQKSMLDHIIDNLGTEDRTKLTDWCQETFPSIAATFGQREPNRREAWMMGLMAEHTWRRQVLYKEFYNAFRVGALTDTYSDSRCRQSLISNLDVCCPGWETVSEEGVLYIHFPELEDVRASCEKAFGKISWPKTDEEAMIPIRKAEAEAKEEAEKKDAYETASLKIVMEYREATLDTAARVRNRERHLEHAIREHAYRKNSASGDLEASAAEVDNAETALGQAKEAHEGVLMEANARSREQRRRLEAGEELLEG